MGALAVVPEESESTLVSAVRSERGRHRADGGGTGDTDDFDRFASRHLRELSRLGYLLTGDHGAADDLAADTLLAAWRQWDRVRTRDNPVAYVRRIMVNLAATRVRGLVRERRRLRLFQVEALEHRSDRDVAAVVDVRSALLRLPVRRRACVVLRHAFDLSEAEVAEALSISVGTVKSQTSRGMAQLQQLLGQGAGPPGTR